MGNGELGIGRSEAEGWGIGHRASGIGHRAWAKQVIGNWAERSGGIGHRASGIGLFL
ncbi:hypothetical protein QUB05_11325 [Microcoleus sp. F10-C6]|uniref:hypothetical protein n=1 Tax=unclassified Microcoleus TaxID=2642155 RepID=UPI002FCF2B3F